MSCCSPGTCRGPARTPAAYWANTLPDPYSLSTYTVGGGFYYAPPFAQAFWPLTFLPFPVVAAAWAALLLGALWLLLGAWSLPALLFVPIAQDIYSGNVNLLLAAVAAWGLRWPWLWAFPLFTKVTPGVGLAWFAARREWRSLAAAGLVTGAIAVVSLVVAPDLWREWIDALAANAATPAGLSLGPLWLRVAAAGAIVAWGGITGRTWTIAVAMVIAFPRLWVASLAVLAAVPAIGDVAPAPLRRPAPAGAAPPGLLPRRLRPVTASSLTIILPAYNEEHRLGPALDELFGYLRRHGEQGREGAPGAARLPDDVRVLVVDDGSTDATVALAQARPEAQMTTNTGAPWLAVLAVPHGGKGAAVRAGMLAADTDLAVFTDADMATPPDQIPLLALALVDNDVALGSRIQADGSDMRRTQPGFRRLIGRAFHGLASLWAVGHVQDTQCGFKGFTREAARDLFARQRITSIVFDVEIIYLARRRGYGMAIVPIVWSDKHGSRMHPGLLLGLRVAWDLFRTPLLHRRVSRRRS